MGNVWPALLENGSIYLHTDETRIYSVLTYNERGGEWTNIECGEPLLSIPFKSMAQSSITLNISDGQLVNFTWDKKGHFRQRMDNVMMRRDEFIRLFSL